MQNVNISLNYNCGYKWYEKDGIYVKGYLFDEYDNLLNKHELVNFFKSIDSKEKLIKLLEKTNGLFTGIIEHDNKVFLFTDRTRTFPILYMKKNNTFFISDDALYLKENFYTLNKSGVEEFLSTGYVTGNETLLDNTFQVQSGEIVEFEKKNRKITKEFYFDYITLNIHNKSFEKLKNDFLDILGRVAKRMINYADGRQLLIPLSGGYDSRLIVSLLKKYNYENVVCFTYGNKDSFEVEISKKVAERLKYKWFFVEYNERNIQQNYINEEIFLKYIKYAFNYISKPHLQDFFAVKHLVENQLVDNDSIFIPGHSGDFLGGSHLKKGTFPNDKNLENIIIENHYIFNKNKSYSFAQQRVRNTLSKITVNNTNYYSFSENWNLKERQSKFIINANRVYEYFEHEHLIPLWDKELIGFFKNLPLEYKIDTCLYEDVIFENIFSLLKVDYKKNTQQQNKNQINIKNIFKKLIPENIKSMLKAMLIDATFKDINNFRYYCDPFFKNCNKKFRYSEVEYIYIEWLLKKLIYKKEMKC